MSKAYRWYVVGVLTFAYLVSFLDRQILALLIGPIKADFDLSDTQISLLIGLAFGIFYVVMGIPLGRLADRANRKKIIMAGASAWTAMTAACGLAGNFMQLFAARIGVGVGEAALTPSALSIISDIFPRKERSRAIATYNLGISLGTGLAMVVGGLVIGYVMSAPPAVLPIFGTLKSWQYVFLLVALPGVLVVLLMLTVREPDRRESLANQGRAIPLRDAVRYLMQRGSLYVPLFLGMSVTTIVGYAYFTWIPEMLVRQHGWDRMDVGIGYGIVVLTFGPLGALGGGWLTDHWFAKGVRDAPIRSALLGTAISLPGLILVPLMPSGEWALAMIATASIGPATVTVAGTTAIVMVTPNQLRAQTVALYLFTISILGLTIGPTAVALVTDRIFYDEAMLHWSIAIVAIASSLISLVLLWLVRGPYRAASQESDEWSGSDTEAA
ncbi:spinster family MFS transporter [Altererythrobacter sp. MF3-039]|uniref:spinster family MFS transporter n=1 Tax=Altererythrobacter sp. MF3-039 TaxID=3252901 RepID=UPI00390C9876